MLSDGAGIPQLWLSYMFGLNLEIHAARFHVSRISDGARLPQCLQDHPQMLDLHTCTATEQ